MNNYDDRGWKLRILSSASILIICLANICILLMAYYYFSARPSDDVSSIAFHIIPYLLLDESRAVTCCLQKVLQQQAASYKAHKPNKHTPRRPAHLDELAYCHLIDLIE